MNLMIQRSGAQPVWEGDETRAAVVQKRAPRLSCLWHAPKLLVAFLAAAAVAQPESLIIWPATPPGENQAARVRSETADFGNRFVGGKKILRVSDVSTPDITIYRPASTAFSHPSVLVCPGGGYQVLAMDIEGTEVCAWLRSIGVTAILLKYRVPSRMGPAPYLAPLQDVQRALSLVRFHSAQWHLDPGRIGIIGFSAGGDLAALASTRFNHRSYSPVDEADQVSCRPDFAMLIYPAYLAGKEAWHLAPEITVTSNTPPSFLVQTEDDPIHVENSLDYYLALKKGGVPVEMHLYAAGGHGYGLRATGLPVSSWPKMAEAWMHDAGLLNNPPTNHR